MERVVRADATGMYIKVNGRFFRPIASSNKPQSEIVLGAKADVYSYSNRAMVVRQWISSAGVTSSHPLHGSGVKAVREIWSTKAVKTKPKPRAATVLKEAAGRTWQGNFGGASVWAATKPPTSKMKLSMNGASHFNKKEWLEFSAKIEQMFEETELALIGQKLKEEIDLDDQLQDYLKEKGLA